MYIKSIEEFLISIPLNKPKGVSTRKINSREYLVVKVITDGGKIGWGYTFGTRIEFNCVRELTSILNNRNPLANEQLWDEMYKSTIRWGRRGAIMRAISAIDMALWDIKGKVFDVPIYSLLGGDKKKIPVYASSGYFSGLEGKEDLEFIKNDCISFKRKGFKSYKLRVGSSNLKHDIMRVKTARETLGDDVNIFVDVNNGWDILTTINFCNETSNMKIRWLEEPILHDNLSGLKKILEKVDILIAVGELESTRWGFQNIIDYKAADILQPDVTVVGGVTEMLKVINIAITQGFTVIPHAFPEWHLHFACAIPEISLLEYFEIGSDILNLEKIFKTYPEAKNGYLECLDVPGLGFEIDEEKVNKYKVL